MSHHPYIPPLRMQIRHPQARGPKPQPAQPKEKVSQVYSIRLTQQLDREWKAYHRQHPTLTFNELVKKAVGRLLAEAWIEEGGFPFLIDSPQDDDEE